MYAFIMFYEDILYYLLLLLLYILFYLDKQKCIDIQLKITRLSPIHTRQWQLECLYMTMHGLNKLVYPDTLTPKNAEDCIIRPSSDGGCFMASTNKE